MKKMRNLILIGWLSAVALQLGAQSITFDMLKKKYDLPQSAQQMMQYYINRKTSKKPLSAGGFYVELYKYFNRSNLDQASKNNILKAMAFLATGSTNDKVLQDKINDINDELSKVELLVTQEEIDIDDLK